MPFALDYAAPPACPDEITLRAGVIARLGHDPFDASAARAFARVSEALRRSGRKVSARAFDTLIAATAISRDLPLHTCNPADFEGIPELDLRPVRVGA